MELILLESFAAFFLLLHLIRPLFKGLWNLDGLVLLPLLALGIIVGIFPAYGFRPECVPLLVFSIFINLYNTSAFFALFSKLQNDDYRDRGLIYTTLALAVFGFSFWAALYLAPPVDLELSTGGVETLLLQDRERNADLWVRIYGPDGADFSAENDENPRETGEIPEFQALAPVPRPLLFLLPPTAGSIQVVDGVCAELRDRGFTVLSYSRPGFDSPAVDAAGHDKRLFPPALYRLVNALARGLSDAQANAYGKDLERGRRADVEFLLQELVQNKTFQDKLSGANRNCVFLAGYGAGGAALLSLSGSGEFTGRYGRVRGVIAIESPLLSSLEGEALAPPPVPASTPFVAAFREIRAFADRLSPRKITGIGTIPQPLLPNMFIVSDRVIQTRTGRYETILRTLGASRNASILAAVPGAGPFDYSGSPRIFPAYSLLFSGAQEALAEPEDYPGLTASLITNFAALVLEAEHDGVTVTSTGETLSGEVPLEKTELDSRIYLETGGVWQLPDTRFILHP